MILPEELLLFFLEQEKEFMKQYKFMFEHLYRELGTEIEVEIIKDVKHIKYALSKKLILNLFGKEEFLQMNVEEHFYKADIETDVFCITLLDMDEACIQCGELHTNWFAVFIDTINQCIGYGSIDCYESERVKDSQYTGKCFYELLPLIKMTFDI